ncbi:RHS repeat-associated core domain-containing protein [Kribbella albertanoniae]|uniref:RHS repeat-associated core domain-containing protein n=1 Tax=Kribbella albertanoniae TaxID=1266829 RepID=UPI001404EDE9|nr:RHS repeat-associated core domain-containing protein [Kribbella albertanoniae]
MALILVSGSVSTDFIGKASAEMTGAVVRGPLPLPSYDPAIVAGPSATVAAGAAAFGASPGAFDVGEDGSSRYSVPLKVVAGRGGYQPSLALTYSGEVGNGHVGVGFGLSGVSRIDRCVTTALDGAGQGEGPQLADEDRLCLDGQKLVLVGGTYGGQLAEYRTFPDTHVRVRSFRAFGTPASVKGPTHFTVETGNGETLTFGVGGTVASVPSGSDRVNVSWFLARSENRSGNVIEYRYETRTVSALNPSEVERWLASVEYGDVGKLDRRVEFGYLTRPDPLHGFMFGVRQENLRRLVKVTMSVDAGAGFKTARSYRLDYQNRGSSKTSKLEQITECGAAEAGCMRPTRFEWSEGIGGFNSGHVQSSPSQSLVPSTATSQLVTADLTGDGRTDLAWPEANGWQYLAALAGSPDKRYRSKVTAGGTFASGATATAFPVDFDQDGRVDLIPRTADPGVWRPFLTRGSLSVQRVQTAYTGGLTNACCGGAKGTGFFGDFNGDGDQDVLEYRNPTGSTGNKWSWRQRSGKVGVLGNDADNPENVAFSAPKELAALANLTPDKVLVLDIDGDGRDEVVFRLFSTSAVVWDVARDRSHPAGSGALSARVLGLDLKVMDLNGDGLADLVTNGQGDNDEVKEGQLYYRLNTGRGFTSVQPMGISLPVDGLAVSEVADADNDGRQDLLIPRLRPTGGGLPVYDGLELVRGSFTTAGGMVFAKSGTQVSFASRTAEALAIQGFRVIDADGDALDDLILIDRSDIDEAPATLKLFTHNDGSVDRKPDLLAAIRDGNQFQANGAPAFYPTVRIRYSPRTDATVYEPGTCGQQDSRVCLPADGRYVVSHVERDTAATLGASVSVSRYVYRDGRADKRSQRFLGYAERRVFTTVAGNAAPLIERFFYSNTSAQFDPRLEEQWTVTTLPNGQQSLEQAEFYWTIKTTSPAGNFFSYAHTQHRTYEFPTMCCLGTMARSAFEAQNKQPFRHGSRSVLDMDVYGNVREETTRVNGHEKQMTVSFTPDVDTVNWLISRPKQIKVKDRVVLAGDAVAEQTRTSDLSFDPGHVRVRQQKSYGADPGQGPVLITDVGYDGSGNVNRVTHTDQATAEVREATAVHDPAGFPHATMNAAGFVSRTGYDPVLGVAKVGVDLNGLRTDLTYDTLGRLRAVRSPSGAVQTTDYVHEQVGEEFLRRTQVTDGTGASSQTVIDRAGRVRIERFKGFDGKQRQREYAYEARGNLVSRTDYHTVGAGVTQTSFEYDDAGRVVYSRDAKNAVRVWSYDGLKTTATDPRGNKTRAETDQRGQVVRAVDGVGSTAEAARGYAYGAFGTLLSSQTEGVTASRNTFSYDDLGNMSTRTDPERGTSTSSYNAFGEVTGTVDALGRDTVLDYDVLGRPTSATVKLGGAVRSVQTSTYDADGSRGSRNGTLRRTERTDHTLGGAQSTSIGYSYDDLGRLSSTVNTLPAASNPTINESMSTAYEYDQDGRVTGVRYPTLPGQTAGVKVAYDYSPAATSNGRMTRVRTVEPAADAQVLWTAKDTDDRDRLTVEEAGDGVTDTRLFDPLNRVVENKVITNAADSSPGKLLNSEVYTYDGAGNLTDRLRKDDGLISFSESFAYDALDRVISAYVPPVEACPQPESCGGPGNNSAGQSGTHRKSRATAPGRTGADVVFPPTVLSDTWSYDKLGNIVSSKRRGAYTYDSQKPTQVMSVTGGIFGDRAYGYDSVGNQITRPGTQVSYNDFDLPAKLTPTSGEATTFLYYGTGERAQKTTATGSTTYLPGLYERHRTPTKTEHRLLIDTGGSTSAVLRYEQATPSAPVAKKPAVFNHTDRLGSTSLVTANDNTTGGFKAGIKETRSYDAFGLPRHQDWSKGDAGYVGLEQMTVDQGYTGHNEDRELGLTNMKGRIYDATLGRFLTPDPNVDGATPSQAWNRYTYVSNNPATHNDPTGLTYCLGGLLEFHCDGGGGNIFGDNPGGSGNPGTGQTWKFKTYEIRTITTPQPCATGCELPTHDVTAVAGSEPPTINREKATPTPSTHVRINDAEVDAIRAAECGPGGTLCADEVTIIGHPEEPTEPTETITVEDHPEDNPPSPIGGAVDVCEGAEGFCSALDNFGARVWDLLGVKSEGTKDAIMMGLGNVGALAMAGAFSGSGTIDPSKVRFSQASARQTFANGGSVLGLAAQLKAGTVQPSSIPPIRIFQKGGQTYTLDNRRLAAFQKAGVDVPYVRATPQEVKDEGWKFTTKNQGTSIRLK